MMNRRTVLGTIVGAFGGAAVGSSASKLPAAETRPLTARGRIRLWTLGHMSDDPSACLFPTPETIRELADMLGQFDGKSDMELIWGPDLSVTEVGGEKVDLDVVAADGDEIRLIKTPNGWRVATTVWGQANG